MPQPSLFFRPADLAARFRRESLAARADDRIDTADHFERIASLFEELEQRNATEGRVAATTPGEPALSDPAMTFTNRSIGERGVEASERTDGTTGQS